MRLSIKQTQALDYLEDDETNELLFGGGAGGGKSALGCYWQLKRRLKFPGTKGVIGRAVLKTLKETTLATLFEIAKMQGVSKVFKFNGQSNQLEFINGSLILLKDLATYPSDPEFDELGSLEITDGFIDEANQVSFKARNILKSRIRFKLDENGLIPKMLYSCNPSKNWAYIDFYKPFKEGKLKTNRKFIQALINDNPFISEHYRNNLINLDKQSKERLLYGNWEYDDDPATLIEYDAIVDCFTNDHIQPTGAKYISADLAMQGRDSFVAGLWDGLVCNVKLDKPKATGKEIEADLKQLMVSNNVSHSHVVSDSDGLGAYLESYLTGIKEFHGGAKPTQMFLDGKRTQEFNNLKSECGFKLAEYINARKIKIICTEKQKQSIIEELGVLKRDKVDADTGKLSIVKKEYMKEILNRSPDYLDMLLMRMYFEIKQEVGVA
jgi:hypothetical protein